MGIRLEIRVKDESKVGRMHFEVRGVLKRSVEELEIS